MRHKFLAPLLATVLLASLGWLVTQAQEPKAKKPASPRASAAQSQEKEKGLPQVFVFRAEPGSRLEPPAKRPRMKPLPQATRLRLLRGGFADLPAMDGTVASLYLTQYAPQICSDKGWFAYYNPKQVDCGLAYFWGNAQYSSRAGALEFALNGQTGHRYLVELFVGWPDGKRTFQVSGLGTNQTITFEFEEGGFHDIPAVVDWGSLPTGWHGVRLAPPTIQGEPNYGGDWFFIGVVVSALQ